MVSCQLQQQGYSYYSSYPLRFALIPRPFSQIILNINHPRLVEDMCRWLYCVPILDSSLLITLQLTSPDIPFIKLCVIRGDGAAASLAALTYLPWLGGYSVIFERISAGFWMSPRESRRREVNCKNESSSSVAGKNKCII